MAEALVYAPLISGFINAVCDRLVSPEAFNLIKGKKLDQELVERLKTALRGAEALLVDAERKQFEDSHVEEWLRDLQDSVYNAGDSLDHVFTKDAIQKEVRASWTDLFNFKDREMENKMVNKIEGEVRRIENLLDPQCIPGGLKKVAMDSTYLPWTPPQTTSLVKGNIHGREDDQKAIINIINDGSDRELSVIPIVGMGGVGKTTLAQWLYNNEDLIKEFPLKAWVCISDDFDIVKVTMIILKEITKEPCDLNNFNSIHLDLKQKLSSKKFFIVLDDVWSEDRDFWNNFRIPFMYGAKGSTILVTTRSEKVASIVQPGFPYSLNGLSEDYCWSVFADNACLTESNGRPDLEEIGREIVKKCKGLPLAAETLGCLLRTKHDTEEWKRVLMSDIWEIPVEDSKIIPALLISYYHLPAHLKGCFVYCSLFPKDHAFDKDELILLWMAEDLLRQPKRGETLEEVGNECFHNLASRLFFKLHKGWNGYEYFLMHDLLHDLAILLAGDFYCRLEELGKADGMSTQTRHLSYGSLSHPISTNLNTMDRVESLRTFFQVNSSPPSFRIERMPHIILSKLKFLRVLSFCSFKELDFLPDSIGKLIHLRYLDLSCTSIKTLPESLGGLYNLQTLKLLRCNRLKRLPRGICNLVNLRHLDIRETYLLEMPRGISELKHLHVLGHFVVGRKKDSARINEVGKLSIHAYGGTLEINELGKVSIHAYGGTLEIKNLENVTDCNEAKEARLKDKTDLDKMILEWSDGADIVSSTQTERDILDKLQPHHGLKELVIDGYRGTIFPNWVGHCSYNNMTRVSLLSCTSCCMLPSLGQLPSLKSLCIKKFEKLETIGAEFYNDKDDNSSLSASPFPSLEYLSFESMQSWKVWSPFDSNNAFPKLKSLEIFDCPILEGDLPIPNHLPALEELELRGSDKVGLQELPLSLEKLSIGGCQQVESMCRAMSINRPSCLDSLTISDCLPDISLPWDFLAESLTSLSIMNCRELEFPSQQQQFHKLKTLVLNHSCDLLTLLHFEAFPKLEHLKITECKNLESFSLSESPLPHMSKFNVTECKKLKSLPSHMNTHLPNLDKLGIKDCPDIDSVPEGGLPPSLKTLGIMNCEKLLSNLSSMGVLESLTYLEIHGKDCQSMESFPNEGLLPGLPSLTFMTLWEFPNLETLECKQLLRLTSLQELQITSCPKLESIAGERLPHSLLQLLIYECPLLGERCKMKHEQIWPKISHIPRIEVDFKYV